jgi:hypothetical protein
MPKTQFTSALALVVLASVSLVAADKIDPRLATVRKAFVVPVDELGDDRGAAACLADHLSTKTPIEAVATKEDADVVFRIKAHIPSATTRYMVGMMGGSPSIDLEAQLPDGTKLWADGAKARRGNVGGQIMARGEHVNPIACALADEMIDGLLGAMRKSRDAKK